MTTAAQNAHFPALGKRQLRVGVIGCGKIADSHLLMLRTSCGEVEVHVCDLNRELADRRAAEFERNAYASDDPDALLSRMSFDAVHVLTPPDSHLGLGLKALEAGAHLIVEKPTALDQEETEKLLKAADDAGKVVCVDHSLLFMPCVAKARERVARGELGRPVAFHCFFGHAEGRGTIPYGDPTHWTYDLPGGVLQNLISHPASLLVEFLGEPTEIHAHRSSRNVMPRDIADSVQVAVTTDAGYGTFMISMAHGNHLRLATLWCEKGTVFLDLSRQITVVSRHRGPLGMVDKTLGSLSLAWQQTLQTFGVVFKVATGRLKREPGVKAMVEEFYRALRDGDAPPVTAESAHWVARIQQRALFDPLVEASARSW